MQSSRSKKDLLEPPGLQNLLARVLFRVVLFKVSKIRRWLEFDDFDWIGKFIKFNTVMVIKIPFSITETRGDYFKLIINFFYNDHFKVVISTLMNTAKVTSTIIFFFFVKVYF